MTAVIVDDEYLAREGLLQRLQNEGDIKIIGQCSNGQEALQVLQQRSPDVLFVDVEMPGIDGVALVQRLIDQRLHMPYVVFVTAFKDFAHQAFTFQAMDYLLKPFADERLQQCLKKLRSRRQQQKLEKLLCFNSGKSLQAMACELEQRSLANDTTLQSQMTVKSGTDYIRLALHNVVWVQCVGDYLYIHSSDDNHIIRKTLTQLEQQLDRQRFARVNRSSIINVCKLQRLIPNSNGEYIACMSNEERVKVSRRYKHNIEHILSST